MVCIRLLWFVALCIWAILGVISVIVMIKYTVKYWKDGTIDREIRNIKK